MESIRKIVYFCARTDLFFYALFWLMVLLVVGTISQKNIGIYLAQKEYFSSWVLWVWDLIPLPGGMATLALIFIGLSAKLVLEQWSFRNAGTIVTHMGVLLLLFGGFLTSHFSYEGSMTISENGVSNYISDYHNLELVVQKNDVVFLSIKGNEIKKGAVIDPDNIPFRIDINNVYKNTDLRPREGDSDAITYQGFYAQFELENIDREKQEERNISSVIFDVSGAGESDGRYAVFESMNMPQVITIAEEDYVVALRHERTILPFSIKLLDFEKNVHPGTNMPKSFKSDVVLEDQGIEWQSRIEMNKPLRYKGYTFYQSSYVQGEGEEVTVLAVVKNIGRLFPYISSIVMCIGLLIHLWFKMPVLLKKKEDL